MHCSHSSKFLLFEHSAGHNNHSRVAGTSTQVLTRSWESMVLREWIMSECSDARSSRSPVETAAHAVTTIHDTGRYDYEAQKKNCFFFSKKLSSFKDLIRFGNVPRRTNKVKVKGACCNKDFPDSPVKSTEILKWFFFFLKIKLFFFKKRFRVFISPVT